MTDSSSRLSKSLKKFRQSQDISQERLAELLGVSRATANKWEGGDSERITLKELDRISKETNLSITELLGLKEEPTFSDQLMTFLKKIQTLKPDDQEFLIQTWSRDIIAMANNFADIRKKRMK